MADKKKPTPFVTPTGVLAYAWIDKKDTKGKFATNKHKATLLLKKDDAEVKDFCKKLAAVAGRSVIKDGDNPVDKFGQPKPVKDAERGYYMVTAKSEYMPKCVDAKRNPLPKNVRVMSGDLVKLAIAANEFDPGKFNLWLNAVQLIDKRSTGFDASSLFAEEDGFEAEGDKPEETATDGSATGKPTDNLDF